MSTIRRTFHNLLTNHLTGYSHFANKEEYEEFENEISEFKNQVADMPISKQYAMFMERYGGMYLELRKNKELKTLSNINKTLEFFRVLTIIWLVLSGIALLIFIANS